MVEKFPNNSERELPEWAAHIEVSWRAISPALREIHDELGWDGRVYKEWRAKRSQVFRDFLLTHPEDAPDFIFILKPAPETATEETVGSGKLTMVFKPRRSALIFLPHTFEMYQVSPPHTNLDSEFNPTSPVFKGVEAAKQSWRQAPLFGHITEDELFEKITHAIEEKSVGEDTRQRFEKFTETLGQMEREKNQKFHQASLEILPRFQNRIRNLVDAIRDNYESRLPNRMRIPESPGYYFLPDENRLVEVSTKIKRSLFGKRVEKEDFSTATEVSEEGWVEHAFKIRNVLMEIIPQEMRDRITGGPDFYPPTT